MLSDKMDGVREQLLLNDDVLGPQSAQDANQEGVRKSSRQRKQSNKALCLSQSSCIKSHACLQSHVKTVAKKRRQQWSVCNLCARVIEREKRSKKPSKADRENFEAEGVSFGEKLAEFLNDPEAKRLYCPFYQVHPCGCVQKYISGDLWKQKKIKQKTVSDGTVDLEAPGENAHPKDRGLFLLSLRNESMRERREIVNVRRMKNKAERDLMFPEEFTQFVLSRRLVLRRAGLCERGCQRVLGYSNNFLHKKVTNGPRLPPSKGKAVGVLIKLEDLPSKTCCYKKCVKMAEINLDLLSTWRHKAAKSQKLSRQVIMEMFTPDEKKHVNCPTFVGMVTGSCKPTIMKVKTNMILSGDSKQALEREKGKVQHICDNPNHTRKKRQSRISAGTDKEALSGSSLTHANTSDGKTTSPSCVCAPLTSNPIKSVAHQPPLDQLSPIRLLEDRHKKELEELRRKQQEELENFEQLQCSQQKEQQQSIVLEQAKVDQNLPQPQTPENLCKAGILLPLIVSSQQSLIPSADSKVPAVTQAFNPADGKITLSSSGHSLNISSPFPGTQIDTSQSCSVAGEMDKNGNQMTSKALPRVHAKPLSQASGASFQQSLSLPPSTLLSPSSLGAHTVLMLGSKPVTSTSRLPSCNNKEGKSKASSSSTISTFGKPALGGHLAASDKMSLSSQTPQITQPNTLIATTSLQTSTNQRVQTSEFGHRQKSLQTVNLFIGGDALSQSIQDLQGHTTAYSQSQLPDGKNSLSYCTQNVLTKSAAVTQRVSPTPYQSTLNCQHVLRGILPASDLQSIEGNTLTYSTVSLTRGTAVSSSSQKVQKDSNVSSLNAKAQRVSLENNTVSQHALVDPVTSVPSPFLIVNGSASDEQQSLSTASYLLSDNGQIYCILQGESQCLERQKAKSTVLTVSTSICQTVSQPSSSVTSSFSKMHFTSPLLVDTTMLKPNAPSASSQCHPLVIKPTVQSSASADLKNEAEKKERQSKNAKSISMSSSAEISGEDPQHFGIKFGHHKIRATRDKSQPVGIVHPHVTQSKSGPAQEELSCSQDTRTLTSSHSLGNGQNYIISSISMEQNQGVARQNNQITLPQRQIVSLPNSTSSALSLESLTVGQTFSNPFSCVVSHGSQVNQLLDSNHQHRIMPLHQQQTNFNHNVSLRRHGIALPQKLTLSEEQLHYILGTHNHPPQQTLTQQQHNAVPREFTFDEHLQQSGQAQIAQNCQSLQSNVSEEIKQKSQFRVTGQHSEHQEPGVQIEEFHLLTGNQSMENAVVSSSSTFHTESNNLQDLQPTIQLMNGSTNNDVTQVLMSCQSNLLNPSTLASSEPHLRTELKEVPTHRHYGAGTNRQIIPISSTSGQTTKTEIPLLVSPSSVINNHSTWKEPSQNNPFQIVFKENMEKYSSDQIQQVSMIKDGSAVSMTATDGQPYQSLSTSNSTKANQLIRSSVPYYTNGPTEQCLKVRGNMLKTNNILESSKDNVRSPLVHCNPLISMNNADNFNTTVSIDLEQNRPSVSTNSNIALLPCPIHQSFETVPTSQIAADSKMAMNFNQQINDDKVCIQMPSHEVPVIQHTLDQKKIVVLASNNHGSFPVPVSSSSGNQQIIINFPSQDSKSTSPFISPINHSSSVVVPILDEHNGLRLICSEPAQQIQDAETQCMMKPVGSVQINQEIKNLMTADAQNTHILSSIHHEQLNAQNQITHSVETSSSSNQSLNAHYFPIPNSPTYQYPFPHTIKQLFSKTQGDQHYNYTQANQIPCLGIKATSTGGSEESVSSANKSGPREANFSSRPKCNPVILVPDKPGFPRFQVTQLSPEPDKQHFFSELSELASGSSTVVATPPTTQMNASSPHNETILQMIAQSLISQNLTLTNGTQIVLPFPASIPESSTPITAKYEVTSKQQNKNVTNSQRTLKGHSIQEEMKTIIKSGKPFSFIPEQLLHQEQPDSQSRVSSHEGSLNRAAVKTVFQYGADSSESSMIGQLYGKMDEDEQAGNSSTHIIGDTKIGSLVKTREGNKISDAASERMEAVMEMLKSSNTSSLKITLPEVNNQASLAFLEKDSMAPQSMLMVPLEGYKNSAKIQEDIVKLNVTSPQHFVKNSPSTLSELLGNVKGTNISNLPSVRSPDKNSNQLDHNISAHGSSEQNALQLSFLHDKELVIDLTNESAKPSQRQEYGKIKDQPAIFQAQEKVAISNQMALVTPSFLSSHVLRDKKSESLTLPERICVPPLVDGSSPNVSSFTTFLENSEALIRLSKTPAELQSQSSVILSKDNSHDKPHPNGSSDTTIEVEHKRERPCSLSQINLIEVSSKEEMQARRRTRSTGTGTNGSSKKSHVHSSTSLPSSAVTFTRDTATTDDSAGPPNVTLVSPTFLKRKQLQELESAAALSQSQSQRTKELLIITPSRFTNEENQGDARFSLALNPSKQYGTISGIDVANSLVVSNDFLPKATATYNTDIMSTTDKSNVLFVQKTVNTLNQRNKDVQNSESLCKPSSPLCVSQQNKTTDKRSGVKSRKHSKPPTIRDILSLKESNKTQALVVPTPLEEMQCIVPVSGHVKFMSDSPRTQILSTEDDKNASHDSFAFDVEGKRSSLEHRLAEISSSAKSMTRNTDRFDNLQPQVHEKICITPESVEVARGFTTTQTEGSKTFMGSDNGNIISSRISSAAKCNDLCKESSTEVVCPYVGPPIHEVNSKNSSDPDHDPEFIYELTSDDQTVKKDADFLSITLTKPSSECILIQSESLTTDGLFNEATKARCGIHQICNSKAVTSVTHSSKPNSHHTSSMSAVTKTYTLSPKNSMVSELLAKHSDHVIGYTDQQQCTSISKNFEVGGVRAASSSALNKMENEIGLSVKNVREDSNRRWKHLAEDKKKSFPYVDRLELESCNTQHSFIDTKDELGSQRQKLSFHLLNVSPSKELSTLETGASFKPNQAITRRVAPLLASSVTTQSFSSVSTKPLNSSQSFPVTTSHNISQYGDTPNISSQLIPEALISSSLQNSTPLLSHMLQSSPVPLRSGAHKKSERNTSMMWTDTSTDKEDKQASIQKNSQGKNDQKCSVAVVEPSVIPNNSFSACIQDKTFLHTCTETVSASCAEIPKMTSDRITQVIDNMYKRPDEIIVSASSDQSYSRMPQAGRTDQSLITDKKQSNNKQRCSTLQNGTHNTLPKKRESRKRTISDSSGPDALQGSLEAVYNSDHPCKDVQSPNLSSSESKSGKRSKSKREGSGRDRKKGVKSDYPGRCQTKRVKFSDVITNEDPHIEIPDDKSPSSNIRSTAPIMLSSLPALKDNIFSSSNLQPINSQDDSNTLFKFNCVNEKETNALPNLTPSSHGMVTHQNITGDHSSAALPQKDHYSVGIDLQQANDNNNGVESSFWPQQSSEDLSRKETMTDISRQYLRPVNLPRNYEQRKEAEGVVGRPLKNEAKSTKMTRSATESLTVSPSPSYSAQIPDNSIAESKEGLDRGYQVPWAYSGEHESSFDIISAHGYSILSQKLRQDPTTSLSSTESSSCLLPSPCTSQISSCKQAEYLESHWQESENADIDVTKLDNTSDPSVKRQKALQSDYKLAQQMALQPSQSRSRHPSQEVNDQSLDCGLSYIPQAAFAESGLQELYGSSCIRSLYSVLQENVRLKHAVALASENHSRQRNLSAADKQKNEACSGETDFLRRNSSMPSSPFEPDNVRKSPRAVSLGKYGSSFSLQSSHSRHPSSQEGRSRNASGSYGQSQHYGESDISQLMEVDAGLGDSFHTHLNYNCFVPLSNQDVTLDIDPIPGQIDSLRLRNYQDSESDVHSRHRNLSSSSFKSTSIDSVMELEHGSRSRNPSASSLLRYFDHGNIRSRNPSGSSNRRSRPGSCSSDREFPEMDMLSLLRNSPFNQAWFS